MQVVLTATKGLYAMKVPFKNSFGIKVPASSLRLILISFERSKIEEAGESDELTLNYIELPLNFGYNVPSGTGVYALELALQ